MKPPRRVLLVEGANDRHVLLLAGLPGAGECAARFPDKHRVKARIHAWLSIQREPGKPLGQAITARYLDAEVPQAQALVGWLRRLFVEPSTPEATP